MLHGFLTALAIGPTPVPPSEWLPRVWGEEQEEPSFESLDEANRILGLLLRFHNQIVRGFLEAPEEFARLLNEWGRDDESYMSGEEWCCGFSLGVALSPNDWRPLFEDENAVNMLAPIIRFSSQESRQESFAGQDPETARKTMLGLIAPCVLGIYAYWKPSRKVRSTGPRTELFGIGRRPRRTGRG